MKYRAKSSKRILEETAHLARAYGQTYFEATDTMLNPDYLKSLFPEICSQRLDYQFYFNVRPTLKKSDFQIMSKGGVRSVRAGVESFSSNALKLMRKGLPCSTMCAC